MLLLELDISFDSSAELSVNIYKKKIFIYFCKDFHTKSESVLVLTVKKNSGTSSDIMFKSQNKIITLLLYFFHRLKFHRNNFDCNIDVSYVYRSTTLMSL